MTWNTSMIATRTPITATTTEQLYEDYADLKAADMIERIYIPLVVGFGIMGNTLCFITLVFSNLRNTSTCIYMAAIAVLDSIILTLSLCVLIRRFFTHSEFYLGANWTCGFVSFLFYFSIHVDVLLILAMTVDRFIVVKFPLKAQRLCTPRSALKAIAGIGLFSFALNFQIVFTRGLIPTKNRKDPHTCWHPDPGVSFYMKKIFTWIDASIYSFIPFLTLLILNILIIRQLRSARKFSQQFTEQQEKSDANNKTRNTGRSGQSSSRNSSSSGSKDTREESLHGLDEASKTRSGTPSSENQNTGTAAPKKASSNTNITVMLLLVSCTFLALTSPIMITLLYSRYYWLPSTNAEKARSRLIHAFVDNLMYSNHAVNFLLYCISGQRFRQELKRTLARICRCCY